LSTEPVEPTPYAATAWDYRRAGWLGVLPLPVNAKSPVPRGFTGWAGSDPSGADVQTWIDDGVRIGHRAHPAGNIGLRLPRGVYGLDVDDYGLKTGGLALGRLVELYGALPATWTVSSREESISGIRLFRADHGEGRVWRNEPGGTGAGIESIHFGHRYAVVWPSMHPDTGRKYRFRRPDGVEVDGEIPRRDELPWLPAPWVWGLSEPGAVREGEAAGHAETVSVVEAWPVGDPCRRVSEARDRALNGLVKAISGDALHPNALGSLHELTNLGNEGHRGVRRALAEHHDVFIEARRQRGDAERAGAEWWRMVRGAVGKLLADQHRDACDCDQWAGVGFDFTPDDWPAGPSGAPADLFSDPAPLGPILEESYPSVTLTSSASSTLPQDHDSRVFDPELTPLARLRAELVTAEQMAQRPAPVPIVAGLLYRDTLAWMIGKSGSFKSFVALDLAAHVAADKPWAGRRVWGGPVVYLVAEGAGGMPLRARAWREVNGPLPDRLIMLPRAIQVAGPGWPVFIEACVELSPAMVIVDTQARVTVGVKENDNAEMGQMIEKLAALQRATRACVLIVHHIGRQGEDARGASAIDGAQDTELKVSRKGGPKELRAVLTTDKQKDAADTGEIDIKAQVIDLGVDERGEPLSSLVTTPDLLGDPFPDAPWRADIVPNQALILDVLREMFSETGGTDAQVRVVVRERGLRDQKWLNSQFRAAWNRLLQKDLIERVGNSQRYVVVESNATVPPSVGVDESQA
jgi:hypothetical protein